MSVLAHSRLPDPHQTWWQLAVIQLTGYTSLPVLASSVLILQNSNLMSAILTLIIGNIILWVIRWGLIAMSFDGRKSILDISREYLGNFGSYFIALLVLSAASAWFVEETTLASSALSQLLPIHAGQEINHFFQIGVFLGIVSTLLCIDGMPVLRWLATICFPLLVIAFLILFFASDHHIVSSNNPGFSLAGLPIVLAVNLGISVDLPTFFRHSQSYRGSIRALTVIQLVSFAMGVGSLYLGSFIIPWLDPNFTGFPPESSLIKMALIVLIFLSVICTNVCHVYAASVGWELVAPLLAGVREFLIIGLGYTIIFVLASNIFSFTSLANMTSSFLVNLGLVLVIAYICRLIWKRPPTRREQLTYFGAWLLAALVNMLQVFHLTPWNISTILAGFLVIALVIISSWMAAVQKKRGS